MWMQRVVVFLLHRWSCPGRGLLSNPDDYTRIVILNYCLLAGFCSVDHENPPLKDPLTEFSVMVEEGKIKMVERRKKKVGEIFMA